jgi:glycosyltransferase involved in cell wall biosynthesis
VDRREVTVMAGSGHEQDAAIGVTHIASAAWALSYVRGQAAFMRERGIALSAITSASPQLESFGAAEGIATHAVDIQRRITPIGDLRSVWALARHLRRTRPAIVHGHTPKGGLLGMLAATLARVPGRVYTLHGLVHVTATGPTRRLLMASDRIACALADRVLCVSESVREVAIADGICPEGKIVVLGAGSATGVDAEGAFNPASVSAADRDRARARHGIGRDDLVVGFVGRIVRDKGIEPLAEAWRAVSARRPEARLLLIGPIEARDAVPAAVLAALREDPSVILAGEDYHLAPAFAIMDLLALPTYREGFGNVLIEAAAMEVPTVAARIPGVVDAVVDGVTGTLVPPGDARALAGAIERYLADAELRSRHGRAGRERVLRAFRPRDVWEGIWREYLALLEAPAGIRAGAGGLGRAR